MFWARTSTAVPSQRLDGARERRERRAHGDLRPSPGAGAVQLPSQLADQCPRRLVGAVHLPVAGDQRRAPGSLLRASTPGSLRPSISSSEAPPPVDTWSTRVA